MGKAWPPFCIGASDDYLLLPLTKGGGGGLKHFLNGSDLNPFSVQADGLASRSRRRSGNWGSKGGLKCEFHIVGLEKWGSNLAVVS